MGIVLDKLPGVVERLPGGNLLITSIDTVANWSRASSVWPLGFGTKCCAIEMLMATGAAHQDMSRFGSEVVRQTPRQADLMVIAGAIVKRMALRVRTLYEQMGEPRYVIATGSCAISGGPFMYDSYTIVRGVDEVIPVDVYVPGCPPRPEAFFWGLLALQRLIKKGETIRHPGVRRKPVMTAMPAGITMEEIRQECRALLEQQNVVDVAAEVDNSIWAAKVKEWMEQS